MFLNYSTTVSNIVCIDLLNSSKEDIINYCAIENASDGLRMYLKHLHTTLHRNLSNKFNPHLVYIENDYILGTTRYRLAINKFLLGGLEVLPDAGIDKWDKTIFPLIEKELYNNNSLQFTDSHLSLFNVIYKEMLDSKKYNTAFMHAHIEISDVLQLNCNDLCENYKLAITFLDCVNQPEKSLLTLHKIYYKNKLPIIFVFKTQEGLQFIGWNNSFLSELINKQPLNLYKISKQVTLDAILDKINDNGMTNLNTDELIFLKSF